MANFAFHVQWKSDIMNPYIDPFLSGDIDIPVAKSDALQTVALNVPRYAATLALYILITQACNDF